jgi:hypothetical protein
MGLAHMSLARLLAHALDHELPRLDQIAIKDQAIPRRIAGQDTSWIHGRGANHVLGRGAAEGEGKEKESGDGEGMDGWRHAVWDGPGPYPFFAALALALALVLGLSLDLLSLSLDLLSFSPLSESDDPSEAGLFPLFLPP